MTLESGERVNALTYVADRLHEQYAGRLDRETMLAIVRAGHGQSGDNAAYVTETHDHLAAIGVHDSDLEWLAARLRSRAFRGGLSRRAVALRQVELARLAISPVEKVEVGVSVKAFSAEPIVSPFALMTPERMDEAAGASESVLPEDTLSDVVAPDDGP